MKTCRKIEVNDGIDTVKQSHLISMTRIIAPGLNEEEFLAIVKIYDKAISRLQNS